MSRKVDESAPKAKVPNREAVKSEESLPPKARAEDVVSVPRAKPAPREVAKDVAVRRKEANTSVKDAAAKRKPEPRDQGAARTQREATPGTMAWTARRSPPRRRSTAEDRDAQPQAVLAAVPAVLAPVTVDSEEISVSLEPGHCVRGRLREGRPREASEETEHGLHRSATDDEDRIVSEALGEAPEISGETPGETDSFDEEVELLRCEADLVEAAAEIATTSADDDLLTTDPDLDDDEDGLAALPTVRPSHIWRRPSVASVVIEEDEEDISSGLEDDRSGYEGDLSEMRSRLWAQSLLRLKRSIDEIHSLCEFESDMGLCEQVQGILQRASGDFASLMKQLDVQHEYGLLAGEYPFKSGVAWTTRTPRASKSGESALEQLERAHLGSPSQGSTPSRQSKASLPDQGRTVKADSAKPRSRSLDPKCHGLLDDTNEVNETEEIVEDKHGRDASVGSGERERRGNRSSQGSRGEELDLMVHSVLQRVHSRLGRSNSKPSPEEVQKRSEDRHRRAQQLRASQDDQRMHQLRRLESRILAARERRQQKEQRMQRELLEKMTRARRQYQEQLRTICQRAKKENRKTAEVVYIAKQTLKCDHEKVLLKQKQENASVSRVLMREQMRKKLIESANRVAKVSENRRRQLESWQYKVQQELEEKERLASQRREEHIHSIRLKSQGQESRSEMVRGKRRGLQEEDEKGLQALHHEPDRSQTEALLPSEGTHSHSKLVGASSSVKNLHQKATSDSEDAEFQCLEALRLQLSSAAFSDEEALRIACEFEGKSTSTANTAHRARISKLAADLKKALGLKDTATSPAGEELPIQVYSQAINLDRADSVLTDFCKVLNNSQREADYALVLQLGCAGHMIDACLKLGDTIFAPVGGTDRVANAAWKQMSSVMLNTLKWLGLLCKQKMPRVFLLLTNRVVMLADVAISCLGAHASTAAPVAEMQSMSASSLSQVLHVLSLQVKQSVPDSAESLRQKLITYLLICGLSDKLTDMFKRAEIRGMRLFDAASPTSLLLIRAMGFLGTLVIGYHPQADSGDDSKNSVPDDTPQLQVVRTLRRTELFGIVSVLVSILLSEGRREKSSSNQAPRLPQTLVSFSVQAVKILNQVARIDLLMFQETLGTCHQQELYHLLVCFIDYCSSRLQGAKTGQIQEESDLLHETIVLLGYYCLQRSENQGIACYGEGQPLLTKITSLPLNYFMEEKGRAVLFPTILATCFQSKQNSELLRNEMDVSLLCSFLSSHIAQKEDGRPSDASVQGFGRRFPVMLWQQALEFFTDEGGGSS